VSLSPGYTFEGLVVAMGLACNEEAEYGDEVNRGGQSMLPGNLGSKSSGGIVGGVQPAGRWARKVAWLA